MDFWDSHEKIRELRKGSYGSAVLFRNKRSGREFVVKEVDVSRLNRKDAREAEQEAKVDPSHKATYYLESMWQPSTIFGKSVPVSTKPIEALNLQNLLSDYHFVA